MDEIVKELRELAEHHQSYSDEVGDVEANRARTCMTAASMLEEMVETARSSREQSDG